VIVIHIGREQMIKATIQLYESLEKRLLTYTTRIPIASKIERLLKGQIFFPTNLGSHSKAPSPVFKIDVFNALQMLFGPSTYTSLKITLPNATPN
jgi:hypothetical protein